MKILLVCSAGMSTDILRGELIKYAKKHSENRALFVSMGYEKDIFGSFAYDFELSQKLIFG